MRWGTGVVVSPLQLLSATPSSIYCPPAAAWGPSHRMQSFINCSNKGPSLPSGIDCSSVDSPQDTDPTRSLLLCELSVACNFLQGMSTCYSMGSSMGCSETTWFTKVLPRGCRETSASAPRAPSPLLLCLQGCFSHIFLTPFLSHPFLNITEESPVSLMSFVTGLSFGFEIFFPHFCCQTEKSVTIIILKCCIEQHKLLHS